MGILNKLMFWKKEPEYDFEAMANKEMSRKDKSQQSEEERMFKPDNLGLNRKMPGTEERSPFEDLDRQSMRRGPEPTLPSSGYGTYQQQGSGRDIELINSKLDTIKAVLVNVEQRMANLEREISGERKNKLW
jgi:hypothetical protein